MQQQVLAVPRAFGQFGDYGKRIGSGRLGVIVIEIVDHLFDAQGIDGRLLTVAEESPHVAV